MRDIPRRIAGRSEGQQGADRLPPASEATNRRCRVSGKLSRTLLQFIRAGDVLTVARIDPARSMAELQDIVHMLKTMGANVRRPNLCTATFEPSSTTISRSPNRQ